MSIFDLFYLQKFKKTKYDSCQFEWFNEEMAESRLLLSFYNFRGGLLSAISGLYNLGKCGTILCRIFLDFGQSIRRDLDS